MAREMRQCARRGGAGGAAADVGPRSRCLAFARTSAGRALLAQQAEVLEEALAAGGEGEWDRDEVLVALGERRLWLGEAEAAVAALRAAGASDPWLLRRAELQAGAERARAAVVAGDPGRGVPMRPPAAVPRVDGSSLTPAAFAAEYAVRRRPVVLTGLMEGMLASPWDLQHVAAAAGDCRVVPRRMAPGSHEWAALEPGRATGVAEWCRAAARGGAPAGEYLFDVSLPLHAPKLAAEVRVPAVFGEDLLKRTRPGSKYRDSFPSLFVAPQGALSELHVDTCAPCPRGAPWHSFRPQLRLPLLDGARLGPQALGVLRPGGHPAAAPPLHALDRPAFRRGPRGA